MDTGIYSLPPAKEHYAFMLVAQLRGRKLGGSAGQSVANDYDDCAVGTRSIREIQ